MGKNNYLLETIIKKNINSLIESVMDEDDEFTEFDNFVNNYPNDSFKKEDVTKNDLISFVKNSGDFLYYMNGRFHAANSSEIVNEIMEEIERYEVILSDDLNGTLEYQWDKLFDNNTTHVAVFKVETFDYPYYIIYEEVV